MTSEHDDPKRPADGAEPTPAQAADEQWNVPADELARAEEAVRVVRPVDPALANEHVPAEVAASLPAGSGAFAGDGASSAERAASSGSSFDWRWIAPLALIALVFVAFSPALDADWVSWDDDRNFTLNPYYRGLGIDQLKWMFTTYHMAHWHPVTWLTLGLDYELWSLDAAGYHRTNLVLHAAAAVAAFFFARRFFRYVAPAASETSVYLAAAFGTALFALHPLRVESVVWITERRDVLSGLFFFLTLLCWMRYVGAEDAKAKRRAWIWSVVWFVLAGMSKVAVFPLPFVLLVLDAWPLKRAQVLGFGRIVKEKLALFAVTGALMVVGALGQGTAHSMYSLDAHPLPPRLVHMGFTFFFYPVKTLLPRSLLPMYEMPPDKAFFDAPWLVPAIIGASVLLVALLLWRKWPAISVAWAAFGLFILPTSGLTQAGSQIAADRYSYLSCYSFALLAAGCLFLLRPSVVARWIGVAVGTVLVVTCCVLTHAQSRVWKDTRALWTHVIEINSTNSFALDSLGHVLLGDAKNEPDPVKKLALINEAIGLHKRAFDLKNDARHLLNVAEGLHERAFADPDHFEVDVQSAYEACTEGFKLAEEQQVRYQLPWYRTRGSIYMDLGRYDEAARDLSEYLADPNNAFDIQAYLFLGQSYVMAKRPAEASQTLVHVLENDKDNPQAWAFLGDAQSMQGRWEPARTAWLKVIEIQQRELGAEAAATDPFVQAARQALPQLDARIAAQKNAPAPNAQPQTPLQPVPQQPVQPQKQ